MLKGTLVSIAVLMSASSALANNQTPPVQAQNQEVAVVQQPQEKRVPVEYYKGHTHNHDVTSGAPQHSGGTNSRGCHNGSVPYHCH